MEERDDVLLKYEAKLPKGENELHLFDRAPSLGYLAVGRWAETIAVEYCKTAAVVKRIGTTPTVLVNDSLFKDVVRDALLVHGVRVAVHSRDGRDGWKEERSGTPGVLGDFESLLFEFAQDASVAMTAVLAAVVHPVAGQAGQFQFSCAVVNATLRTVRVAGFTDTAVAAHVDALVAQQSVKEILLPASLEAAHPEVYEAFRRVARGAAGACVRLVAEKEFKRPMDDVVRAVRELLLAPDAAAMLLQPEHADTVAALGALLAQRVLAPNDVTAAGGRRGLFSLVAIGGAAYLRLDSAAVAALNLLPGKVVGATSVFGGAAATGGAESAATQGSGTSSSASPGRGGGRAAGPPTSLYGWLNRCQTGMGSRLLRSWILQPLRDRGAIEARQLMVEILYNNPIMRDALCSDVLQRCVDVDRLSRKLLRNAATLKDIASLRPFVDALPAAVAVLRRYDGPHAALVAETYTGPMARVSDDCDNLRTLIDVMLRSGGVGGNAVVLNPEVDEELQVLDEQVVQLREQINQQATAATAALGLSAKNPVKLEETTQYGWVMKVTRTSDKELRQKTAEFHILNTSKDGVKFTTKALERLNTSAASVTKKWAERQGALLTKLVETVASYVPLLDEAKELLAALDVFAAWAKVISQYPHPMVRPTIAEAADPDAAAADECGELHLADLSHPLVQPVGGHSYVPNTVTLSTAKNAWLVTGPNMGGKSTLMRSVGLAVVLAHIGCFVPCTAATVTPRDAILCRVGSVDALTQVLSTFMVEMLESSCIVATATAKSFIIVDELGRGTSTFDGFGVAWAIAEELACRARAQVLFATHFHELAELAAKRPNVANVHVTADVADDGGLAFLYKLAPGPCGRSFGVSVARQSGMPAEIVAAAGRKAAELEDMGSRHTVPGAAVKAEPGTEITLGYSLPDATRAALVHAARMVAAGGDTDAVRAALKAEPGLQTFLRASA